MPRPYKVRKQLSVTLELLVDVECTINPADPDVGIPDRYAEDLTIFNIGTEHNEPKGKVDWLEHTTDVLSWLTGCVYEQSGDRLEEQLMDNNHG